MTVEEARRFDLAWLRHYAAAAAEHGASEDDLYREVLAGLFAAKRAEAEAVGS